MIRTAAALAVSLLVAGATATASAMTIELADYAAGDGLQSHSFATDAGQMTLSANGSGSRVLDFGPGGVGIDCVVESCGFWDDPALVDALDVLTVQFDDGPLFVNSVTVTDLHLLEWGTISGETFTWAFSGSWSGTTTVDLGTDTSWLRLSAVLWSDYALHSLDVGATIKGGVRPIPEPHAALAFPLGALIVGAAVRRRKYVRDAA